MAVSLQDVLRNNVKEKLARDEVVASMIVRTVRGIEIARIAKTCGFDTLYVDLEHNTFSIDTCSQICVAALDVGITPFVRVPSLGPEFVARVLDGGALGVIGPHIRSAAEAKELVRVAKYPPLGERSAGGQLAQFQYRDFPAAEANAAANAATTVIAMLETKDGLARVNEIAAVEGIDILLIGTNDLCASSVSPVSTTTSRSAMPTSGLSRRAASTASMSASVASDRGRTWWRNSWLRAHATCQLAPTYRS